MAGALVILRHPTKGTMAYETESWPRVQAKHYGPKRSGAPRLIVIHTPIWSEVADGAEGLGKYFATMADGRKASVHIGVDSDSIVQYVLDSFVAFAAPGANHDGIHIEIIGTHTQTRQQWRDKFSLTAMALAADATAQYCLKYSIPTVRLSDTQLRDGSRGIVGHDQVSRVFRKSSHIDPGTNFPWTRFMGYVRASYADRQA